MGCSDKVSGNGPSTFRLFTALLMLVGCFFAIWGVLAVLPPRIASVVHTAISGPFR